MKKPSFSTSILSATLLGAALLTLGALGFTATTGEPSKLAYSGKLWCVSNWIEAETDKGKEIYLPSPDGRPQKDPRLKGRESWWRGDQVEADNAAEAEQKATILGNFEPSDKVTLRQALDRNDKAFYTSHFNRGATTRGPCLGTGFGDGMIGMWIKDAIRQDCYGLSNQNASAGSYQVVKEMIVNLTNYSPNMTSPSGRKNNCDASTGGGSGSAQGYYAFANDKVVWTDGTKTEEHVLAEPTTDNILPRSQWDTYGIIIPGFNNNQPIHIRDHYAPGNHAGENYLDVMSDCTEYPGVKDGATKIQIVDLSKPISAPNPDTVNKAAPKAQGASPACPDQPPLPGQSFGQDYRSQIAQAFMEQLDRIAAEQTTSDDNSPRGNDTVDQAFSPGNAPEGVLRIPAINESYWGLVGRCNIAAAGMALAYRTGKFDINQINSLAASGNTYGVLAGVGSGVRDVHRPAYADNWNEIKYQVLVRKNPVVLATDFGSHNMHYITITGFRGNTVYFNDGAHFVGDGSTGQVANRSASINYMNSHLNHATSGYRYLYAK